MDSSAILNYMLTKSLATVIIIFELYLKVTFAREWEEFQFNTDLMFLLQPNDTTVID